MITEARSVELLGVDGSVWDLTDPLTPCALTDGGFSGLHLPPVSHQWAQSARVPGRRHKGVSIDARELSMTVLVGDLRTPYRRGREWDDLDAEFWAALDYHQPATLRFGGPGGRTIGVRLDEGNEATHAVDAAVLGKFVYTIDLVADDPFFHGEDVTASFQWGEFGQDYYDPDDPSALKYISGGVFDDAVVANDSDEVLWPRYRATAPYGGGVRIGVTAEEVNPRTGAVLQVERAVTIANAPPVMLIDTDPRRRTIIDGDGNNLWPVLGNVPRPLFAPLAPKTSTLVKIGMDAVGPGAGVDVTITPLYRRAW